MHILSTLFVDTFTPFPRPHSHLRIFMRGSAIWILMCRFCCYWSVGLFLLVFFPVTPPPCFISTLMSVSFWSFFYVKCRSDFLVLCFCLLWFWIFPSLFDFVFACHSFIKFHLFHLTIGCTWSLSLSPPFPFVTHQGHRSLVQQHSPPWEVNSEAQNRNGIRVPWYATHFSLIYTL